MGHRGETEKGVWTKGGLTRLCDKSSNGQTGWREYQDPEEVTCRITHSSLFSSGRRVRAVGEKDGASRGEVGQAAVSFLLKIRKRQNVSGSA